MSDFPASGIVTMSSALSSSNSAKMMERSSFDNCSGLRPASAPVILPVISPASSLACSSTTAPSPSNLDATTQLTKEKEHGPKHTTFLSNKNHFNLTSCTRDFAWLPKTMRSTWQKPTYSDITVQMENLLPIASISTVLKDMDLQVKT